MKIFAHKISNILKLKILLFFSFASQESSGQLNGLGLEINSLINQNSANFFSYGLDLSFEKGGLLTSYKNLIGLRQNTLSIQNPNEIEKIKTNIIRHQIQGKYWFGNFIRTRKLYKLRCADKIKITEDYHFKPYLLVGLDNSFLIGKNIEDRHKLKMVSGIGANIKKFGNISSAQLLFVELRPNFNIKKFDPNHFENDFSIEASIGLKFY
ncbi:MAG: hypothetical protein CL846_02370 [Crocinitomicaceae bacterium]|nr:hypothetical protein [Crocinitomicaceae bacterium]|tara:strand:- start:1706 stop:2335 length:630 start_codon:yes stop_codon:yes gene_type:complete